MKLKIFAISGLATLFATASFAETNLRLVEVITSPERTEVLQGMVDEYTAANPDVSVEIISLPWGQAFEQLATMVAGGDIPDLVEMPERWLALYAGNDQLLSLEDYYKNWEDGKTLSQTTLDLGRVVDNTLYEVPYGFYLRAMFYNKKLLEEAGVAEPPKTMDDFMAASEAVSKLDGKYGYCLRGAQGGFVGWMMFSANSRGNGDWFTADGKSTMNEPESVAGLQYVIDLYQKGYAPKDAVNWGFNEVVSGFYSGTCAFLDQDPDALIAIKERMEPEDFAVIPMPVGPHDNAFPTIGYAGWSIFKASEHPQEAWDLIAHLESPESNLVWAKNVGVIPIHQGAEMDPFFNTEQFKGWFEELNNPAYTPLLMPAYLEQFGYFTDTIAVETTQRALLGEITAQELGDQWAEFLTGEYAQWKEKQ